MKNYKHRIVAVLVSIGIILLSIEIYRFIFEHIPVLFAIVVGGFSGMLLIMLLIALYCYATAQDEEL